MVETTENFLRIEAIFHEAFAAPGEARAELIEAQCGGDRELAAEVRLLLDELKQKGQRIDYYCWDLYAKTSQWYTS